MLQCVNPQPEKSASSSRVVLIVDVWHPQLPDSKRLLKTDDGLRDDPLGTSARHSGVPGGLSPRVWRGKIVTQPSAGNDLGGGGGEPTTGNGILAVALNSCERGPSVAADAFLKLADPCANASEGLVLWLGSNNMWDVSNVSHSYNAKYVPSVNVTPPGLAARAALGGLTFETPCASASDDEGEDKDSVFYSEERIASGEIYARRSNAAGVFEAVVSIDRKTSTMLCNCTWRSSSNSPATINVTTWVTAGRLTTAEAGRSGVGALSRTAVERARLLSSPRVISAALATALLPSNSGTALLSVEAHQAPSDANRSEVVHRLRVTSGEPLYLATTYSDTVLEPKLAAPALVKAVATAAATLVAAGAGSAATLSASSASFWRRYWQGANVSLPAHPGVEYVWYTAQYMSARDSSERSDVAAPGLFGPMITSDKALWGGDDTLDYDFEKQYFGVAGSNKGELANAYFANILEFLPTAAKAAKAWIEARRRNGTLHADCTADVAAKALHFPAHIAAFGFQSRDRSIYDHWNGELASMLFINDFEFYRDLAFARAKTYPLLDGLTAMRWCSLTRSDGGKQLDLVDSAHEGFMVNNSVIANSFIRRVVAAQLEIGAALTIEPPHYLQTIRKRLVALPVAHVTMLSNRTGKNITGVRVWLNESPGPAFFQLKPWNVSIEPCLPGNTGWQTAVHCWNETGGRLGGLPSDHLAKYPVWPSEFVSRADEPELVATAQATARAYSLPGALAYGRDTVGFIAAIVAGTQPPLSPTAWTAEQIVTAIERVEGRYTFFDKQQGKNVTGLHQAGNHMGKGINRAVQEMLLSAPAARYVELFPMWPRGADASFNNLRAKGAYLVSASWSAARRTVTRLSITSAAVMVEKARDCVVKLPWAAAAKSTADVECGGQQQTAQINRTGMFTFRAPLDIACKTEKGTNV